MIKFLGFGLTKISAERFVSEFTELKIDSSMNVKSIEENLAKLGEDNQKALTISFGYSLDYSDKIAKIDLEGKLIVGVDSGKAKEIIKNWKKKELDEDVKVEIFNMILIKCNIKAIQLEDELGLPAHFRMPSLTSNKE